MSTVIPKAEYPRPDRDRSERWLSLNGQWQLESSAGAQPITVPFAWETAASGVGRTWLEEATYRRTIEVPAWGDSRVFLCFGAVHHRATVSIDGVQVGTHQGGYTSFEFDVTGIAAGTVELVVEVEAPADKRELPHGKQRSIPRDDYDGVSFTPTSGIWQSVWLEARGRTWVSALELRGDSLQSIEVRGMLSGDAPAGAAVTLAGAGDSVTLVADGDGSFSGSFVPASPSLWSPADPYLYELLVTAADDRLLATAGLRSIEARGEELYLNGERLYLRGVLDQGYWPASGPTAPTDAALRERRAKCRWRAPAWPRRIPFAPPCR
ncbi:MAG: glycoside hydrolase family 2, partial [Rhodoglobus sp.]|nr:glycoside hydrolase family 2 [Rhodoglobus sp.]